MASAKIAKPSAKVKSPALAAAAVAAAGADEDRVRKVPAAPARIVTSEHACDAPLVCDDPLVYDQATYVQSDFVRSVAKRLYERGAVSFGVARQHTHGGAQVSAEFTQMLHTSKLFRHHDSQPAMTPEQLPVVYVGGAFGALGTPELDHHPTTCRWREYAHSLCVPVLGRFIEYAGLDTEEGAPPYRVAQYPDRLLHRYAGVETMAESWHRDIAPFTNSGDYVLGGWLNTSTQDQFFSFIAQSHLDFTGEPATYRGPGEVVGFSRADKDAMVEANRMVSEQPTCAARVRVPPGGFLLFFEHCLHEVLKTKQLKHSVKRLFLAFQLTRTTQPLLPNNGLSHAQREALAHTPSFLFMGKERASRVLDTFASVEAMMSSHASVPLKSGQPRLMYPHRWWMPQSLRYLLIMSAGVTSTTPELQELLFEWRDTTPKMREAIQKAILPIGSGDNPWYDRQLVKALVVLNARGDLPGATREAMLPARIRVVRQVWPALSLLPASYRYTPYSTEHLEMFKPGNIWSNLTSPWRAGDRQVSVVLHPIEIINVDDDDEEEEEAAMKL